MKYIIAILFFSFTAFTQATGQQAPLLNKTWKIKQVNTVYHSDSASLYHKDSTNNAVNYSDLQFNFENNGTYTTATSNDNLAGIYEFKSNGDSVVIDNATYLLVQLNADSFTTRTWSLQLADQLGNLDTVYTYMKLYSLAALPVNLMSFSGKINGEKVALSWTTAQEQNNKGFEVLYSATGSDFETIGTVAGKGNANSISQYSFSTLRYVTGKNYYRLKQLDYDGNSTLTKIVTVDVAGHGKPLISFTPNPVSDKIRLAVTQPLASNLQLSLTDVTGKQVWTGFLAAGNTNTTVYVSSFSKGTYILVARNNKGEKIFFDKLVIQ